MPRVSRLLTCQPEKQDLHSRACPIAQPTVFCILGIRPVLIHRKHVAVADTSPLVTSH